MLLSKLLEKISIKPEVKNYRDLEITTLVSDSRKAETGCIFFALDGKHTSGSHFLADAVAKGAAVVVVKDDAMLAIAEKIVVLQVREVYDFMVQCLQAFYEGRPGHIVAITGTNGKTSVAEFVRQALEILGKKSASIGTLGVKYADQHIKEDTLTMREICELYKLLHQLKNEGVDYVAMEATSQGLDQGRMAGIVPEIAAFTNLTQDHLDYHSTMEEYLRCKMILFRDVLPEGAIAVLNADMDEFAAITKICNARQQSISSYGYSGDVKIDEIKTELDRQVIKFSFNNREYTLQTALIGEFQAMNLLCSFALLQNMKIVDDPQKIVNALAQVKSAEGRMDFAGSTKDGAVIYIDFAHTPDALEKSLMALRKHRECSGSKGKIFVLFGCGGDRDPVKRPLMGKIANDLADVVIITDDNPRTEDPDSIREQIAVACPAAYNIGGREKAIQKAISLLSAEDILLIAGKGHEKYIITRDGTFDFDEFKIVEKSIH